MLLVTIVLTVFAVAVFSKSVIVVPNGEAWVLERLGRYDRTLPPGLHVIFPFTDRVAFRYSVQPKDEELSDQCVTRDNVPSSSLRTGIPWIRYQFVNELARGESKS